MIRENCYRHSTTLTNMIIERETKGRNKESANDSIIPCCIQYDHGRCFLSFISAQVLIPSNVGECFFLQELQPFPEIDLFDTVRNFHQKLSQNYSPRDHLLKVRPSHC